LNERIKELIKQATNPDYDSDDGPMNELDVEKFAKLIVQECLDIVANADMTELEGPDPEDVMYVACKQVKQHFGVE
jgi:hypothetical protein